MYSNGMDELASLYNQTPCHTPSSDLDTFDHPLWHMEPRTTTIKKCPNMTMDLSVTQELFKVRQTKAFSFFFLYSILLFLFQ
jgi:hypothetical protein